MVNVIGVLALAREAVSHLTGTTVLLGIAIGHADWALARLLLAVATAFLLGALLAGMLLAEPTPQGNAQAAMLTLEALLLGAGAVLFTAHPLTGMLIASCACGLQNGASTRLSSGLLRTTHLTGSYTDLGLWFGSALRRQQSCQPFPWPHALVIAGFLAGGVAAGLVYQADAASALWLPTAMATGLALWLHIHAHILRRRPDDTRP